jgi:hypothetical protein
MLTISGFLGVNLVDPACIARTEGLDIMMMVVIIFSKRDPLLFSVPKKLSFPSKLHVVKVAGESELVLTNTAGAAVGTPRY